MSFAVAIDGPSGAGKSTIAKKLAESLNIDYIDTGAMFRALAYLSKSHPEILEDEKTFLNIMKEYPLSFHQQEIYIGDKSVEQFIRTEEISRLSSETVSKIPYIREFLKLRQQEIANSQSVVMEGRDIGSFVLPNAEYKFFLTASDEIRAKRRYDQLKDKGQSVNLDQILKDIKQRDLNDSTRKHAPLIQTEDAILIDSTHLSLNEVVEKMKSYIEV